MDSHQEITQYVNKLSADESTREGLKQAAFEMLAKGFSIFDVKNRLDALVVTITTHSVLSQIQAPDRW